MSQPVWELDAITMQKSCQKLLIGSVGKMFSKNLNSESSSPGLLLALSFASLKQAS